MVYENRDMAIAMSSSRADPVLCFNVSLLRMMPDLETGDMIGLMSSPGPGLVTEIK